MWIPSILKLKNFISHLDSTFEFNKGQTTLIQGENQEDECQDSNGSGKSAIIEGTIFVLTGDFFRDVDTTDLISNGEKEAIISISLHNSITNQTLEISRTISRKSSSTVSIQLNSTPKVLSSVNEYNRFILETLDISKDDLMSYFIVSKERYKSFLLASDTKKKEIISRFSNSNLIDNIDDFIKQDTQTIIDAINQLNLQKSKLLGQIEVHQENIENLETEETFKTKTQNSILEIENKIQELIEETKEENSNIDKIKVQLTAEIERSYKEIESKKILLKKTKKKLEQVPEIPQQDESESNLDEILDELKELRKEYEETIKEIELSLLGSIECPKCSHVFVTSDPDFDVTEGKENVNLLNEELKEVLQEIDITNKEKKEEEEKQKELRKKVREIEEIKHSIKLEIKSIENDIKVLENNGTITPLENKIKIIEQRIVSIAKENIKLTSQKVDLENLKFESKESIYLQRIEDLQSKIGEIESNILIEEEKKQNLVRWLFNFKKFKTHLTNKSIKSIESYTNLFLSKIKTNLNVRIEGYKLLSDGKTVRENIAINILRNGEDKGKIGKFSGGEKVRVDICNILALQHLINLNSKSGGLDLLLLDEIIESVDTTGMQEILKQLNSVNRTICIITHVNSVKDFENIVKVKKQNGTSKVFKL